MKKLFIIMGLLISSVALFAQPRFRMASNGAASWTSLGGGKYQATISFLSDQTGQGFLPTAIDTSFRMVTGTEQRYRVDSVLSTSFTQATIRVLRYGSALTPIGQVVVYDPDGYETIGQVVFGSLGGTAQVNAAIDEYNSRKIGARMDSLAAINDSTLVYFDANGNPLDTVGISGGGGTGGRIDSIAPLTDTSFVYFDVSGDPIDTIVVIGSGSGSGGADTIFLADGTALLNGDTLPDFSLIDSTTVTDQANGLDITMTGKNITVAHDPMEYTNGTILPTDSIWFWDIALNGIRRIPFQDVIDIIQDTIPTVTATRLIKKSGNDFRFGSTYIEAAAALQEATKANLGGQILYFGDGSDSTLLIMDGANDVLKIGKNFTGTPLYKLNVSGGTRWHKTSATLATSTSGALDLNFIGGSSDNPQLTWYDPTGTATMAMMGGAGTNYITGSGRFVIGATTTTDATPSNKTYGVRIAQSSGVWIDAPFTAIDFEVHDINRNAGTVGQVFSSGGTGGSVNWQNDVQHIEATESGTTSTFNPSKDGGTDRGFVLINNADHVASLPSGSSDTQLEAGDEVTYVLIVAPTSSTSVYVSGAAASVTINGAVNDQGTWSTQYQSKTYHWTGSAWYIK